MPFTVTQTAIVDKQVQGLRNKQRANYEEFLDDLAQRGCAALGYRLSGPAPVAHMCVKHIYGALRAVVAFTGDDEVWVLLVGPHDNTDPGIDIYTMLYDLAGMETVPAEERKKPPCCGDKGIAPQSGEDVIDDIARRAKRLTRNRRS